MSAEWPAQINSIRLQPTKASIPAVQVAGPTAMDDRTPRFFPNGDSKTIASTHYTYPPKGGQAEMHE